MFDPLPLKIPSPWRSEPVAFVMVCLLAAPVVTLLGYGWGAEFGLAWAGFLLALIVWGLRPARENGVSHRIYLLVFMAGVVSWPIRDLRAREANSGSLVAITATLASLALAFALWPMVRAIGALRKPSAMGTPANSFDVIRRYALNATGVGSGTLLLADDPICGVSVAVLLTGVALTVWSEHAQRRADAWLDAVAAGQGGEWTLRPSPTELWWLVMKAPDPPLREAYRAAPDATAVAEWVVRRPAAPPNDTGRLLTWALVPFLVFAAWEHGWYWSDRDVFPRQVLVEREIPSVLWTRMSRRRVPRRLRDSRIPNTELWQDGAIVVVNRHASRVLDAPEVMRRVQDRSLREQASIRISLLARSDGLEARSVIRCGEVVWATTGDPRSETGFAMNFATGEVAPVSGLTTPLSCGLPIPENVRVTGLEAREMPSETSD